MATELSLRVGRRIRQARKAAGLKQRELAEALGEPITDQRISDWERGVHKPSDRYLAKIAEALDRDEAWFYREDTTPRTSWSAAAIPAPSTPASSTAC